MGRLPTFPGNGAAVVAAAVGVTLGIGLLCGAGAARADLVTTKDGKTFEGKVTVADADHVVIETTFEGTKEVLRSAVKSVDTTTPPLRSQLAYRLEHAAGDAAALTALVDWAKSMGFSKEIDDVWKALVAADPKNTKAHKALGHVKVGEVWMTPEEKAAADKAAEEAALRAKGLVPYDGRWVTPEEKAALEKGLKKDGDDWVTEDEWHRRRGETKVGRDWVRVGEKEGKAHAEAIATALSVSLEYLWGPHVDVVHELKPEEGKAVLDGAEKAITAFRSLLKPGEKDGLEGWRIEIGCFQKPPTYARYVARFADENGVAKMKGFEGWARQAGRMPSFWWSDPVAAVGTSLSRDPVKTVVSTVCHDLVLVLLSRYKFNYRFSSLWLQEGIAYQAEMASIGYSTTYTVGRGKSAASGLDLSAWQQSGKWKESLKTQVAAGQDSPLSRLTSAKAGELTLVDLVKCWSVVDWLVRLDPKKFKTFLDATKDNRDAPEVDALKAAYGFDWTGADTKWKAFVQGGFGTP